MRIRNFESANTEPIGEGVENKVFVDPSNEKRVISERKEDAEKNSFRQLRGKYYLTKIVHALLPEHIPDIYQTTQTSTGKQTIDREHISHSESHAHLQEVRKSGGDEDAAGRSISEEIGESMSEITSKLEEIGLGFNIDENSGNYIKNESGSVFYLETFNPWQIDLGSSDDIEMLFDADALKIAIEKIPDQQTREKCESYLERLTTLAEEERQKTKIETGLQPEGPEISKLRAAFISFELNHPLERLFAIKTKEEALRSEEGAAIRDLGLLDVELNSLYKENYLTTEQYREFEKQYKKVSQAIGIIGRDGVDHTR